MQGRRAWVLLLLAAVFTMHGLQCAAADDAAHAGGHGAVPAVAVHEPMLPAAGHDAPPAVADHTPAAPLPAVLAPDLVGVPVGAGHDSGPTAAGHLWALCLAVLAAGLAALLRALARRVPEVRLPRLRLDRGLRAWLSPLRPPDLHSLCLMRT